MSPRKALAAFLMVMMTSPAWGSAESVGNITASNAATIRNTRLTTGSTVFSGDAISVGDHGVTRIALAGGAQAEILGNSLVRLTREGDKLQMIVDRGQASFRTSGGKPMEVLIEGASVLPAGAGETSAIIRALSPKHAVIAAQKGALLLTTTSDGKTYTVREGDALDLSAAAEAQQNGTPAPAGKAAPGLSSPKKKVAWIVVGVGAAAAITAYALARRETDQSNTTLSNEVSPTKLN